MAKTKNYVLNSARNIVRAVRSGRLRCLPVFTRSDKIGLDPSVIYNLKSGTKIEQPYKIATRRRVLVDGRLGKPRSRKSNRVDIPPGPLNAVWVPIGRQSPLQEILARGDPDELNEWYILAKTHPPKVKIYQFIKDLSAALRQTEHMFAGYNAELSELRERQLELSEKLRKHHSGIEHLNGAEALAARVELAAINVRSAQITEIGTDRVARDFNLQFVAQACYYRLKSYADALDKMADSVRRMGPQLRRDALVNYLNLFDSGLVFFASKEISPYRGAARRALYKILRDEEGTLSAEEIAVLLSRAGRSLIRGSIALTRWAESLEIEEIREAAALRQLVPPQPAAPTL